MNTRKWLIGMLALLALVLVACDAGGDAAPAAEEASSGGDAQEATVDLAESLTIEFPEDSPVEAPGTSLTVNYPADWSAMGEGGTVTLTTPTDLDMSADTIESGQALLNIQVMTPDMAGMMVGGFGEGDEEVELSAPAIVEAFSAGFLESEEEATLGDVQTLDLGGDEGAVVIGSIAEQGDALIFARMNADVVYIAIGAAALGEGETVRPTMEAMLASVTVE